MNKIILGITTDTLLEIALIILLIMPIILCTGIDRIVGAIEKLGKIEERLNEKMR